MNYYELPEWAGWLASIREQPDDDNRRLFCADWLDELEADEAAERAEFIRVQCEIARIQRHPDDGVKKLAGIVGAFVRPEVVYAARVPVSLKNKACEILSLHSHKWTSKGIYNVPQEVVPVGPDGWGNTTVCKWSRGFVSSSHGVLNGLHGGECPTCGGHGLHGGWVGDGIQSPVDYDEQECDHCHGTGRTPGVLGELLRREPLTAAGIVVTDREPDPIGGNWCWLRQREGLAETGACLPVDLFAILDGEHERAGADWAEMIGHHDEWVIYPTADAARLALGEALYRLHCPKSEVTT